MIVITIGVAVFLIWLLRGNRLQRSMFLVLLCADLAGGAISAAEFRKGDREMVTKLSLSESGGETIPLEVSAGSGEEMQIEIEVPQKQYTEAQVRAHLSEAARALDVQILGENTSFAHLDRNLVLPSSVGEHGVTASWYSSRPDILDETGVICAGVPEEGAEVTLAATLALQDVREDYQRIVQVFPSKESNAFREEILRAAENQNEETSADGFYYLPEEAEGKRLTWYRHRSRRGPLISVLAAVLAVLALAVKKQKRDEAEQERRALLEKDYPELVSKVRLYLGAGLNMRRTFARIAAEYEARRRQGAAVRPVYEEVVVCRRNMERGIPEAEAYEEFGARCALASYRGLSLMLVQNLKRGGEGLMQALEREVQSAFEGRKRRAKTEGEKITVKLLLPMSMMLGVVIALIMIPAFMNI